VEKSQPLQKKFNGRVNVRVPLDPLDDVPKPKGYPDGPPPRPRDPIDDLFAVGKTTSETNSNQIDIDARRSKYQNSLPLAEAIFNGDRFSGRPGQDQLDQRDQQDQSSRSGGPVLLPQRLDESQDVMGEDLYRRHLLAQQQRQRTSTNSKTADYRDNYNNNYNDNYNDNYDYQSN
jgi:hypothetical protein